MSYHLLSSSKPKARKPHVCIWCGGRILTGETYVYERSAYDGHMQNHKWHLECNAAALRDYEETRVDIFTPWENERPTPTKP